MQAIQKELGEGDTPEKVRRPSAQSFNEAILPEDVKKEAERECASRSGCRRPPRSDDAQYLELPLELPGRRPANSHRLVHTRQFWTRDHFHTGGPQGSHPGTHGGHQDSTQGGRRSVPGGPPGVGKTSLAIGWRGRTGRSYEHGKDLGGLHDEAELRRGHRRTYIGAVAGPASCKGSARAGVNNTVLMLGRGDKLGRDSGRPCVGLRRSGPRLRTEPSATTISICR